MSFSIRVWGKKTLLRFDLIGNNVDSLIVEHILRLRVQGSGIAAAVSGPLLDALDAPDSTEENMRKKSTKMALGGISSLWLLPLMMVLSFCGANLTSEGESLEVVSKGSGKTHTLTLEQINVERNSDGAYLRLFDKSNKTIFVYVPETLAEKAGNLEPRNKYIYKFSVPAGDTVGTMRGDLIEVATVDGKPVSGGEAAGLPAMIILKGPAATGESFTLEGKLQKKNDEKKELTLLATDPYQKQVTVTYDDSSADAVEPLEEGKVYKVKLKLDKADWRIFGTLESVE
ncbi:MAG: hypothetical protein KDK25_00405 [Leptospiraceae bacterium]|nr:hypothetical protein [Leptospiraceae bacterium]MCB1168758.1 hypothetical protein [Leptospiraceae bacterium]